MYCGLLGDRGYPHSLNRLVIECWWCCRLFDGEGILRPSAAALVLEGLMNVLSLVSFKSLTVVLFAGQ